MPTYRPFSSCAKCFKYSLLGMRTHTVESFEPLIPVNQLINRAMAMLGCLGLKDGKVSATVPLAAQGCINLKLDLPSFLLVFFGSRLPQTHYHRYDAVVREVKGWGDGRLETPRTGLFPYRRLFIVWQGPPNGCRRFRQVRGACGGSYGIWCDFRVLARV